jgi:hypothetical protein
MLERLSIGSSQMIVSLPHLRAGQTAYQPKSPLGRIFCPWNRFGPRLALQTQDRTKHSGKSDFDSVGPSRLDFDK